MAKRHRMALQVQNACNPGGVARSLVEAIDECVREGLDTPGVRNDPAVRLITHQLAFLMGMEDMSWGWAEAHAKCEVEAHNG